MRRIGANTDTITFLGEYPRTNRCRHRTGRGRSDEATGSPALRPIRLARQIPPMARCCVSATV